MKSIFVVMRSEGDNENPLTAYSIAKSMIKGLDLAILNFPRIDKKDVIFTNRTDYTEPYIYGQTIDDVVDKKAILKLIENYNNNRDFLRNIKIPKFRSKFIDSIYKEACRVSKYDVVFFSIFRYHFLYHLLLAAIAKSLNNKLKVVVGGPQIILSSLSRDILLNCPFVDKILVGNVEDCIDEYNKPEKLSFVKNKNIINSIIPNYYPFTKFFNNTVNLFTSRNCSYICKYCPNGNMNLKYSKIDLNTVDIWLNYYKKCNIYFTDPYINLIRKRFDEILDMLKKTNFPDKYTMWLHSKKLSFLQIDKLIELQPKRLWMSYDVVDVGLSKSMARPIDKYIDEKIINITDGDINLVVPFIIGLPGETNYTFDKTLEKIVQLKDICNKKLQIEIFPYLHNVGSPLFDSDPNYKNGISETIMKKRLDKIKKLIGK